MPQEPVTILLDRTPGPHQTSTVRFKFAPMQTEVSNELLHDQPGDVLAEVRDLVKAEVTESIDRQFDAHFERRGEPRHMSRPRPVKVGGEYRLPHEVIPGAGLAEMRGGPLPFEAPAADYMEQARAAQRWWEEERADCHFPGHPNCRTIHDSTVCEMPGEGSLERLDRQISEVTGSAA